MPTLHTTTGGVTESMRALRLMFRLILEESPYQVPMASIPTLIVAEGGFRMSAGQRVIAISREDMGGLDSGDFLPVLGLRGLSGLAKALVAAWVAKEDPPWAFFLAWFPFPYGGLKGSIRGGLDARGH